MNQQMSKIPIGKKITGQAICLLILSAIFVFSQCGRNQTNSPNSNFPGANGGPGGSGNVSSNSSGGSFYYNSSGRDSSSRRSKNRFSKSSEVLDKEEEWGISAPLDISSRAAFEEYRFGNPYNSRDDIEEFRVYVQLEQVRDQKYYSGEVTVSYIDWGGANPVRKYTRYSSGSGDNARYNVWIKDSDGKMYFHGFFQNQESNNEGALILVIDRVTKDLKDSDNPDRQEFYGGSVWIMNFRLTRNGKNSCNNHDEPYIFDATVKPPSLSARNKQCWEITTGPYDCRTWRNGRGVDPFRQVSPDDNCYEELADFEGLDIPEAFDVNRINQLEMHAVQTIKL